MITQTIPGTWSVHEPDQPPVEGIAVWKYKWGWKCERCGPSTSSNTQPMCDHIEKIKNYEANRQIQTR